MMMGPLMSALVRLLELCCLLGSSLSLIDVRVEAVIAPFLDAIVLDFDDDFEDKDLKKLPREPELEDGGGRFLFFLLEAAMIVLDRWNISS